MKNEDAFQTLVEIIASFGWICAIPKGNDDDEVPGMIIGTQEYVDKVLNGDYVDEPSDA